ncbi:MAG: motility associated factor glycosyltransferase family protein [Lachnospiraceae bacterium]|nr:motility associated factor glycosyltransferase family protein [Lachnospiraceae bacterium]
MEGELKNITIESLPARDGNQYLNITTVAGSYRMNSNYRPLTEAAKWAEGLELAQTGAVVLMYGLGNGYCVRELLKHLSSDAALILWEPSVAVYEHIKQKYDISDILQDARVRLLIYGQNEREIFALLDTKIHWSNAKKQSICIHPQYDKVFPKGLAFFEEIIRNNNVRIYTNRNTEMHFGEAIATNTAFNLRYVPEAFLVRDIVGKFPKEVPAIIVAAGPSLDKNIEELKRAKGKAVIVATDTALRSLIKHEIIPDFAVVLDAKKPPSYFQNPESHQIPLFAKIEANKDILVLHQTEKIWYDSHEYLKRFLTRIDRTPRDYHAGGSVANAAFSICSTLGFERIVLIGQDLAYQGDVTHAGGRVSSIRAEDENVCYVDGVDGKPVKTRHDWVQYLKWFERVIGEVQGEIEVIDATEGGALIRGAKLMTLAEVIDRYCHTECDAYRVLQENSRALSEAERSKFADYIKESLAEAEAMEALSQQICEQCMEVQKALQAGAWSLSKQQQLREQIGRVNARLQQMNFFLLVDDYTKKVSIPAITEMLEAEGSEEERFAVYLRSNCTIHEAFKEAAELLTPLLEEAL